jgi:AraC-like DNA-binding protein
MSNNQRAPTRKPTLIQRVCDYLETNPDDELTRSDIATKFGVAATAVDGELRPAVNAGRLIMARNDDDGLVWRLGGPKASAPHPFQAGERAAKSARLAKTRATLAIDLSQIKIEKGVVYQAPVKRSEQWNSLFGAMDIEDSFAMPLQGKHALARAAAQYKTENPGFRFSIRIMSAEECRIWRKA